MTSKETVDRLLEIMQMMVHEEPTLITFVVNNAHPKMQVAVYMMLGMHTLGKDAAWQLIEEHFRGVSIAAHEDKHE